MPGQKQNPFIELRHFTMQLYKWVLCLNSLGYSYTYAQAKIFFERAAKQHFQKIFWFVWFVIIRRSRLQSD
jgi:hypothetical protein